MRTSLANVSWPPSTEVWAASIRSSVVLPAPLRPARVSRSRRSSLNETPRKSGSPAMSLARSEAMQTAMGTSILEVARYAQNRMKRRVLTTLLLSATTLLLLAQVALADAQNDHGEGWYGETNDLVVTPAGFILIAGFPLLILLLSLLQWRLDKRKDARKAAEKARLARVDARGGW